MRIFKNKAFTRFARKAGLSDADLCNAISDAERGLIDADLGGGVIKQRIARVGAGKSGGFRTIVLFRINTRAFFVHGFAKNVRDNIREDELSAFKMLATLMLSYSEKEISHAMASGTLLEVTCDE